MQRVLDPAQIEAFAQRAIARIRLPDPANVFSARAARFRKLSEGHAVGDYLRLMATLADAQQNALNSRAIKDRASSTAITADEFGVRNGERLRLAREHGMPPLQASAWSRDERWRAVLHELCGAITAAQGYPEGVAKVCRDIQALPTAKLEAQADLLLGAEAAHGESTDIAAQVDASTAPFIMAALQVHWTRMLASLSHDEVSENIGGVDVPGVCPVCGTLPVASIVRAEKAYQGYRYLHCALCATEWHLVRIKCTHCESTEGIHYHSIEGGSPAIRAEACDHCKTYRKICYQEHDVDVEPVADDLASLAIDLLMTEEGFQRASGHPLLWQA
jgi:FdhE protein